MSIRVYVAEDSLRELGQDIEAMGAAVQEKAKASLRILAAQVHGFVVEEANRTLKSARSLYIQNIVGPTEVGENVWLVGLKKEAEWAEQGYPAHDMLPKLLGGPKVKVSKDGHRYNVIPFRHSKRPSDMSRAEISIANFAKAELKRRGLDKIIKDGQGKAIVGRVAKLNITGPGSPMSRHGTPLLSGLTVYQTLVKNQQTGKESVRRDIMTFRTASDKQRGTGKWFNKGYGGAKIFDKVQAQVDVAWSKMIEELLRE